jgi:hypothetical protein
MSPDPYAKGGVFYSEVRRVWHQRPAFRNATRLTTLLVFVFIVAGCCALVSFQATHLAR